MTIQRVTAADGRQYDIDLDDTEWDNYGHASGKFGGDDFSTYIVGEAGNDKFHITVGASYEESSGRLPRFRSFEPLNR